MEIKVVDVPDVDYAFPAGVIGKYLPPEEEIPRRFYGSEDYRYWEKLVIKLFFGDDRNKDLQLHPKEGIDAEKAFRMIMTCLRSFQPRHEHKTLGVAYLFHSFFEKYDYKGEDNERVSP